MRLLTKRELGFGLSVRCQQKHSKKYIIYPQPVLPEVHNKNTTTAAVAIHFFYVLLLILWALSLMSLMLQGSVQFRKPRQGCLRRIIVTHCDLGPGVGKIQKHTKFCRLWKGARKSKPSQASIAIRWESSLRFGNCSAALRAGRPRQGSSCSSCCFRNDMEPQLLLFGTRKAAEHGGNVGDEQRRIPSMFCFQLIGHGLWSIYSSPFIW